MTGSSVLHAAPAWLQFPDPSTQHRHPNIHTTMPRPNTITYFAYASPSGAENLLPAAVPKSAALHALGGSMDGRGVLHAAQPGYVSTQPSKPSHIHSNVPRHTTPSQVQTETSYVTLLTLHRRVLQEPTTSCQPLRETLLLYSR